MTITHLDNGTLYVTSKGFVTFMDLQGQICVLAKRATAQQVENILMALQC